VELHISNLPSCFRDNPERHAAVTAVTGEQPRPGLQRAVILLPVFRVQLTPVASGMPLQAALDVAGGELVEGVGCNDDITQRKCLNCHIESPLVEGLSNGEA
jgi:hypothetical protein